MPRPFGYGAFVCGGNIIQAGDLIHRTKRERGKGGSTVTKTHLYYRTYAIRVCEGPVTGIRRIWRNERLVYSTMGESFDKDTLLIRNKIRIYLGDEDQLPDSALEATPVANGGGIGNVPAYRGTCYIVVDQDDLTDLGGAVPQYRFEVVVNGSISEVEPNILPTELHQVDQNYYHETNPGAYRQVVQVEGNAAAFFRFSAPDPHPYSGRLIVNPLYEPDTVGTTELTYSDAYNLSGTLYDSGWWSDSETSRDNFIALLQSLSLPVPSLQVGAPPGGEARTARPVWGLEIIHTYHGAGGPGHALWGMDIEYPLGEGQQFVATPDVNGGLLGLTDQELYFPEWIAPTDMPPVINPEAVPVADIVADLLDRVGIPATQLDLSAIEGDLVRGYVVGRQMEAWAAIRPLAQCYFFDMPEVDGKIVAVKRGGAAALTINPDHLIADSEDEETRAQVIEFPATVNLIAPDAAANYEPCKQTARRRTNAHKALSELTLEVPISLLQDEIAQLADKMQKVAWEEAQGRRTITLPEQYSLLLPSDCPTFEGRRWRIVKREEGDGEYTFEMVRDRVAAYQSSAEAATGVDPTPPVSQFRGPTMFIAMNLPRLRVQDIGPGMYYAGQGVLDAWLGYDLQVSFDNGTSWVDVNNVGSGATMGYLLAPFGSEPMQVQLYKDGELESATAEQLANKVNAAALSGREIVQFANADDLGDSEYDLTAVSRGQLGTQTETHLAGASFVQLDTSLGFLPIDPVHIGKTLLFRPISYGTPPESNAIYPFVFQPQFTGTPVQNIYVDDTNEAYTDDAGQPYYEIA